LLNNHKEFFCIKESINDVDILETFSDSNE
jgi:hypothetical protein